MYNKKMQYVIKSVPTDDKQAYERIKIAVNANGIRGNEISEDEDIEYEYNPLGQRSRKVVNDEVTD